MPGGGLQQLEMRARKASISLAQKGVKVKILTGDNEKSDHRRTGH
jgi:phosphatidylserine/phosphatidylglycerophosphate/cardiolipin synthase-like enzyme